MAESNSLQEARAGARLKSIGFVGVIVMFAAICAIFPILDSYGQTLLTVFLINLILVVSFRFMIMMDRWSFCHLPIAGMGGYTMAILTTSHGWSFWPTIFVGGLVAASVGLLISYPVLRTRGFYFFQATFVAGAVIAWSWTYFYNPFHGLTGVYGVLRPVVSLPMSVGILDFNLPVQFGYLEVAIALVSLAVLYHLERIRFGKTLKAIGANADLARSIGINVLKYEIAAFLVGCFFAGVAGVVQTDYIGIAYPGEFAPLGSGIGSSVGFISIYLVMYTIVGGRNTFWGPILGLALLTAIGEVIRGFVEYVPLVFGLLTIITVLALPEGLVSLPQSLRPLLARRWAWSRVVGEPSTISEADSRPRR